MVACGGEPKEEDHALLVDLFLKIPLVNDESGELESSHGFRCVRCKATNSDSATLGKTCEACCDGIVRAAGNQPWPTPEIKDSTLAPAFGLLVAEAKR
eukprot:596476-Heterocapsa_arctica.AAC.1